MENIKTIRLSFVNAFLINTGSEFILIDSGLSMHKDLLLEELKVAGCTPGKLPLLIITHGDFDHTGNCLFLRENYGCKIAMHAGDIPMVKDGKKLIRKKKGVRTRVFAVLRKLLRRKFTFEGFTPDILLGEGQSLNEFGLDAKILHTPGHTPGSISILTSEGSLFPGDTFLNRGKPGTASLIENEEELLQSYAKLRNQNIKMIYPGHGKPFSFEKISGRF